MREQKLSSLILTVIIYCFCATPSTTIAQNGALVTDIRAYTPLWEGERFPDGRPKVPDDVLERMKVVSIDEAWDFLHEEGYDYQFEDGWVTTGDNPVLVGRALTALFMPLRPDVNDASILGFDKDETRFTHHSKEVIDRVVDKDVIVVDLYGKVHKGTFFGNNFATNIYALSKNGIVVDGGGRDLDIVKNIPGFVTYTRGWDPTHMRNTMLVGINTPIRIGNATAMPGDVVLGGSEGVIFIPAHLARKLVDTTELVRLKDEFRAICYQKKTYPLESLYGTEWTEEIERGYEEFVKELDRKGRLTPYQRKMLLK